MIRIREAGPGDAAAIAALHADSWRITYRGVLGAHYLEHELDAERLRDWQQRLAAPAGGQYVAVAERADEGAQFLGFACAYGAYDAQAGTLLENLHTHPQHKQAGVGGQLLRHIARWSVANYPRERLHLWVVEANLAAIGFYRHMGAQQDAQAIWDAPDGSRVPEFRYTWDQPGKL